MRDIKFRGKRKDNCEWVTGYFWRMNDERNGNKACITVSNVGTDDFFNYEVMPETVGQFTPRKDKTGKQICEGDIVDSGRGEIFWDEKFCQFRVRWHDKTFKRVRGDNPNYRGGEMLFWNSEIAWEVIGNIHEHAHLLNPPADRPALKTMTTDPKEGQAEVKEDQAAINAAEDQANTVKEPDAEEGTTEG